MAQTTPPTPLSAAELRASIAEREAEKARQKMAEAAAAKAAEDAIAQHFLKDDLTEDELERLRTRARAAVERGELEAVLFVFPARLCSDGGRAINNFDPDWPQTLQGKAKRLHDIYEERLRSKGYKLHARIESFPGGMPGDVALILSWAE